MPGAGGNAVPEQQPSLDERIAALGQLAERLERHLPPPVAPPPAVQPASDPLRLVRVVLSLFVFAAGCLLVNDVIAIFAVPDEHVFVSVEEWKADVWRDVWAYEAATGKEWIKQPPAAAQLAATYHGAQRARAVEAVGAHLLFLALSVVALRRLRQVRSAAWTESGKPPGESEAATHQGSISA